MILGSASGKETREPMPIHLSDTEGLSSSFVYGCVNTLSGGYIDSEVDLVVPGPQPLSFSRTFTGSKNLSNQIFDCWVSNQMEVIHTPNRLEPKENRFFYYRTENGSSLQYDTKNSAGAFFLDKGETSLGITNMGRGEMSAQTNPRNCIIKAPGFGKGELQHLQVVDGSASQKEFYAIQKVHRGDVFYTLQSELLPSGNRKLHLNHSDIIHSLNGDKTRCFGFIKLDGSLPENFGTLTNKSLKFISSTGDFVVYKAKKFVDRYLPESECREVTMITDVERSQAPNIQYEYCEASLYHSERIVKKSLPDHRYLSVQYYTPGSQFFEGEKIKFKFKTNGYDQTIFGKVLSLSAPVGTTAEPVVIYKFRYFKNATAVYDAYENKKIYDYVGDVLRSVTHFNKKGSGYEINSQQLFSWENFHGVQNLTRLQTYAGDQRVIDRFFFYDERGNVVLEEIVGNFTGLSSRDVLHRRHTYSKDAFNLKLSDILPNGSKVIYSYKKGTNLLESKLTTDGNKICLREFFAYDKDATLIEKVIDDGVSENKEDLAQVTERRITRITPRDKAPFGYPQMTEEYGLDLASGEEILFSRVLTDYSPQGHLLREESYVAGALHPCIRTYAYDPMGNLTQEVDPEGNITTHQYDANRNRICTTAPHAVTRFLFDFSNRCVQSEHLGNDETRTCISHRYNYLNQKVATLDTSLHETNFTYNESGHLLETLYPEVLGEKRLVRPKEVNTVDIFGNVLTHTDPEGALTTTTYNLFGKPTKIHYPDGTSETMSYFIHGPLQRHTGKNGLITLYTYDFLDRPTRKEIVDPTFGLIATETWTYSAFHLLTHTDPEGRITSYQYDPFGREICCMKEGVETRYEYDERGRRYKAIEGGTKVTILTFDNLDRVVATSIEDLLGNQKHLTKTAYDARGNVIALTTYTEEGPQITKTFYDDQDRPIQVMDPLGNITTTEYNDQFYNEFQQKVLCITVTDPKGCRHSTIKDTLGRDQKKLSLDPFGNPIAKVEIFYNLRGDVIRVEQTAVARDRPERTHTLCMSYDCMGRQVLLIEDERRTYTTYNQIGEKETVIRPSGTSLHHEYDTQGRLARFYSKDFDYSYTYNKNHELLRVRDHKNSTETLRTYDERGLLISETLGNGLTLSTIYDTLKRPIRLIYPDGSSSTYTYDAAYLTHVYRYSSTGDLLFTHTYSSRDLAGNILQNGPATITYDPLLRPRSITAPKWSQKKICYDATGNLTSFVLEDSHGSLERTFSYDMLNQLTEEAGQFNHTYTHDSLYNRIVYDNAPVFYNALHQTLTDIYDQNGCLTKLSSHEYTYDSLDRLIRVQTPNTTLTYTYDAFNRLLTRSCSTSNDPDHFLYDGQNEIGRIAREKIVELRVLGEGMGAEIGAAVTIELDGISYTPLHDHNGNVAALLDASGTPVATYRYSAFGLSTSDSFLFNPWQFSSKRLDQDAKLIFFGRRFYHPPTGRWTSPDPQGYDDGPNLYAFLHNNPLTHIDLYGLETEDGAAYMRSFIRGFVDDTTFGLSEHLLGLHTSSSTLEKVLYGSGTAASMAAGCVYGGALLKGGQLLTKGLASVVKNSLLFSPGASKIVRSASLLIEPGIKATAEKACCAFANTLKQEAVVPKWWSNRFHKAASELSEVAQTNIRILRGWAKSKGWKRMPNPEGKPETWGEFIGNEYTWRVRIKPIPSTRHDIHPGSKIPRFDARLNDQKFIQPFSSKIVGRKEGTHLPLEHSYH